MIDILINQSMKCPIVFSLGSCRLLCCFDPKIQSITGLFCRSLHHFNLEFRGGQNFLGKLHTARQHLTTLKFLMRDVTLSDKDQHKLFSMSSPNGWSNDYCSKDPDYDYSQAVQNLQTQLHTHCDIFLFEICSMKNALQHEGGLPIQEEIEGHNPSLYRTKSVEECREDIIQLIEYVNKKFSSPTIILVGHIRNWIFNNDHPYLDDREQIYQLLVQMDRKYENVSYVDPAVFLQKKDLSDDWHYDPNGSAFPTIYRKLYSLFPAPSQ